MLQSSLSSLNGWDFYHIMSWAEKKALVFILAEWSTQKVKCVIYTLWPSDATWQHRSGSTLAQVMACCLTAPSHYLNQCWLINNEVLWHLHEGNFTGNAQEIDPWLEFQNYQFKITATFLRGQWVKNMFLLIWCLVLLLTNAGLWIIAIHRILYNNYKCSYRFRECMILYAILCTILKGLSKKILVKVNSN